MNASDVALTGEVVVLGAGMSGLVGASVLLQQGARSVLVVDQYERAGGNHLDVQIGEYTYDVGSLIFQDDSPLLDHFPELLERYVPIEPDWARLNPQGVVTEYPFSVRDDLLAAGWLEFARLVASAIGARLTPRRLRNARDFAVSRLGARFVRRSGLEHYMERFCGCPIDRIDLEFARSRMAWVHDETRPGVVLLRLWRAARRRPPEAAENQQLARPRSGFGDLYAPVAAKLEAQGVKFALGCSPLGIRRVADGFEIETDRGTVRAGRVVSTIPLTKAMPLIGAEAPQLPTVTLLSLFYSFAGDRGFTASILYNFSFEARWKRLTMYSEFYGAAGGREFFTLEVVPDAQVATADAADAEFRAHVLANKLLIGDLRLEGHHRLENAYPILTQGSGARAAEARARLREAGVESLGRQGAFDYQPTARVSTLEAERALGSPRDDGTPPAKPSRRSRRS